MANIKISENTIPILINTVTRLILLIKQIKHDGGLTADELFAQTDAQTKKNRTEIEAFIERVKAE